MNRSQTNYGKLMSTWKHRSLIKVLQFQTNKEDYHDKYFIGIKVHKSFLSVNICNSFLNSFINTASEYFDSLHNDK